MKLFHLCILVLSFLLQPISTFAVISNGSNSIDQIGQYTDYTNSVNSYSKTGVYNSGNEIGLNGVQNVLIDTVGHRMFVSDRASNRVLIFNLNSSNQLIDKVADFVLGQQDFFSTLAADTQSGLNSPRGLAIDSVNSRLFVSEFTGNRIKVFDISTITNGEPAINILGQTNFTSSTSTVSTSSTQSVESIAYDASNTRLFAGENANRVKIFDVATITDGENAINVLGQTTFTGTGIGNTQTGLSTVRGLAYDSVNSRLFVAEQGGHRVKIFDVATTSNGMPASFVLGQTTFSGATASNTQSGLNNPYGLAYDSVNSRLFVSEFNGNRVKVFDVASTTNGEPAINVLGQSNFSAISSADTQVGMNIPTGLGYDPTNSKLFVSESGGNRIKIFDVASITDGENAVDLIGQYTDSFNFTPSYTKLGAYNSPNEIGFNLPTNFDIDYVNHRLFFVDSNSQRVLVYNLNASNVLIDKIPDYVLGQPDFNSSTIANTQSSLSDPRGVAYDPINSRLFVAEQGGNRIKVFDVSSISNGENAINILGQSDFITATPSSTQSRLNAPQSLAYDIQGARLFVSELNGNRIKVFDVASITDGEPAVNILGQANFTATSSSNTPSGLNDPRGIVYDSVHSRLFVSENINHRVKVFDVASITDGEEAVNVLGQPDFVSTSSVSTQSSILTPRMLAFDPINSRLFVAEHFAYRVKVFDVNSITNGEDAINVIGQPDYTSASYIDTQAALNTPFGLAYNRENGNLYVSELGGNRIRIFDASVPAPVVTPEPVVKTGFQGPTGYGGSSLYVSPVNEVTTPTLPITPQAPTLFTFTKSLSSGMTSPEVKTLQQYLNAKGFTVAKTGPGSVGKETNFFGAATRAALIKFQKANKITPAVGFFGPVTRGFIN